MKNAKNWCFQTNLKKMKLFAFDVHKFSFVKYFNVLSHVTEGLTFFFEIYKLLTVIHITGFLLRYIKQKLLQVLCGIVCKRYL